MVTTKWKAPRGGHPRLWGYGYAELSELLGRSEASLRQDVSRGKMDPSDLRALCEAWQARQT